MRHSLLSTLWSRAVGVLFFCCRGTHGDIWTGLEDVVSSLGLATLDLKSPPDTPALLGLGDREPPKSLWDPAHAAHPQHPQAPKDGPPEQQRHHHSKADDIQVHHQQQVAEEPLSGLSEPAEANGAVQLALVAVLSSSVSLLLLLMLCLFLKHDDVLDQASDDGASSNATATTLRFAERLEEILEQLAGMLRVEMKTYDTKKGAGFVNDPWLYVAAFPKSAKGSGRGMAERIQLWRAGTLGWWTSPEAIDSPGCKPQGSIRLGDIEQVKYAEEREPCLVSVRSRGSPPRVFQFRSKAEAKTWSINLKAIVDQLQEEY
eukprot:TRINITY_DN59448_c0_g1_i1.p1 TRINITY_DN59448_c0_g1~~TRINITY_DN59448_c0_g1_i1.p1  ORF type:complete len:317 (+),score=58.04 TRINITY_DN59448_c0_g1_i1:37-987(+)